MIRKILIIGSGPIVIGQAAEFDYSGTQACLACRQMGVRSVLVNSNPATIQTDPHIADIVYIEPLTVEVLTQIIARERPDGLIATVGGQTALNLSVALAEEGVLNRFGVRVLGTGLEAIRRGEDRELFAATLRAAGQPVLPSRAVISVDQALVAAAEIGYPVMCRSAFALGGAGSGFAGCPDELIRRVETGLSWSGSGQVLVEKSVYGWAEIEYEVIRDSADNCLVVCNMENIDPMGVHTGDSMVVAPSQTLSNGEYHLLRASAIDVVRALGVEGACNVQFALNRAGGEFFVIEVNPRLSRSSALASKATGYPIAKVATRIALGATLPEIRNDITGTTAFFEPALDYVTVKIPRWPFDKFAGIEPAIGTRMRSTGEVMAIGRSFEEAVRKAMRSLDTGAARQIEAHELEKHLTEPNGHRLPAILAALHAGWDPARIAALSEIDPWFVDRLDACLRDDDEGEWVFKMVDTCAAEFEARTPYFYGARIPGGQNEAVPLAGPKAIILGSGPIRIGQGIEFDYATVHACHALSQAGVESIIVNNNPETVSTDYSTSDRLYFEPLDIEAVMAVVNNEREGLLGVIPQFGGQTAINLVQPLHERGIAILGTPPDAIDAAEDRGRTSTVLQSIGVRTPRWRAVERWTDLPSAAEALGFPVLLRPSYVLSGRGMTVARTMDDVERYMGTHSRQALAKPLLIDQFLEGAVELDVDVVSDGVDTIAVIMEQLDECGVHSGDSTEVYPVQTVSAQVVETVQEYTRRLAEAFQVVGLMNVQYAVHQGEVYVLEVNPRASRSVPFASKASDVPLADLAIRVILGERLRDLGVPPARTDRVCVKNVVLPFRVFPDLAPTLGPEMQSTGESMGISSTFGWAYWKAWQGAGLQRLPFGRPVLLALSDESQTPPDAMAIHRDLTTALAAARCTPIAIAPGDHALTAALLHEIAVGVILDRSDSGLSLLRRAADAGVPTISTWGGARGLLRALQDGPPGQAVEALVPDTIPA